MSSTSIAALVFGCTSIGALLGLLLHTRLPTHHLSADSQDVIKLVMGLIATVVALVLGLLISSAHRSFDEQRAEVQQLGIHLSQLDRTRAAWAGVIVWLSTNVSKMSWRFGFFSRCLLCK